jgi:hypothetical protein
VSYSCLSVYIANLFYITNLRCQPSYSRFDNFPLLNHDPFHSLTSHSLITSLSYISCINKIEGNISSFNAQVSLLVVLFIFLKKMKPIHILDSIGMIKKQRVERLTLAYIQLRLDEK